MVQNVTLNKMQHQAMNTQGVMKADSASGYIKAAGVALNEWGNYQSRELSSGIAQASNDYDADLKLSSSVRDGLRSDLDTAMTDGTDDIEVQDLRNQIGKLNGYL